MRNIDKIIKETGKNIHMARLRRNLTAEIVSRRAGISRSTLWMIEKGKASVSMGAYASVLFVLGLGNSLVSATRDDILGRKLQDAGLLTGRRARRSSL